MPQALQIAKPNTSPFLCNLRDDDDDLTLHNAPMSKRDKQSSNENHLRAWREFRRLTQAQLGEKAGTTGAVISLLESGDRALSPKWLRKLAPHLGTRAGVLLDYDPNHLPREFWEIWGEIPEDRRDQALDVLRTFRRTGTGG